MSLDPRKVEALTNMPKSKSKKELQSFLGILNYLSKFSPMTAEVYEPLQKYTSVMAEWSLNRMYKDLYNKAKKIIMQDTCM